MLWLNGDDFSGFFYFGYGYQIYKPWKLTALDQREYMEPYQTVDYAKGGSQMLGNNAYATLKLDGIRGLAQPYLGGLVDE